jgi:hypothetical protein
MKCQADIEILAKAKLAESECLFQNDFFDGAYYLGGYAIELLLKARICKTLRIDDFFLFDKKDTDNKGIKKEIYKPFKVHNFEELFLLFGIYPEFVEAQKDSNFKLAWSVVGDWSEEARYIVGRSKQEIATFLSAVQEIARWIEKYL